jgi:hypothetical protein
LRVGLPFGFFIGPGMPLILAQNDLRRFAALDPGLSFDGFVVTAIFCVESAFRVFAFFALPGSCLCHYFFFGLVCFNTLLDGLCLAPVCTCPFILCTAPLYSLPLGK